MIAPEAVCYDTENGVTIYPLSEAFAARIVTETWRGREFLDVGEWVNVEDNRGALPVPPDGLRRPEACAQQKAQRAARRGKPWASVSSPPGKTWPHCAEKLRTEATTCRLCNAALAAD